MTEVTEDQIFSASHEKMALNLATARGASAEVGELHFGHPGRHGPLNVQVELLL